MALEIPTIDTERLRLRPWRLDDFAPLAAFLVDAQLARFRNGIVDDLGAWQFMTAANGQWSVRGHGGFAVEETETGATVGMTGLWHPATFREPELYWSLFSGAHGRGYAVEMARAVQRWAGEVAKLAPLMSLVHPDNRPSRRVAERLGATIEGETTFYDRPRLIYRHRAYGSLA